MGEPQEQPGTNSCPKGRSSGLGAAFRWLSGNTRVSCRSLPRRHQRAAPPAESRASDCSSRYSISSKHLCRWGSSCLASAVDRRHLHLHSSPWAPFRRRKTRDLSALFQTPLTGLGWLGACKRCLSPRVTQRALSAEGRVRCR